MDNNATNNTPHDTAANEAAAVTASNDTAASTGSTAVRPSHSLKQHRQPDPHRMLRQWLNIIFMIGAVAGVCILEFTDSPTLGIIIILCAMVFKMAECAFRFFR